MRRKRMKPFQPVINLAGDIAKLRHKKTSVQVPIERVMNSIGFAPKSWAAPSQIKRASGSSARAKMDDFSKNKLVILFQVHTAVKTGDLGSISIKHFRRDLGSKNTAAITQPSLGRLTPARMIDLRIDVGIKAIFARR